MNASEYRRQVRLGVLGGVAPITRILVPRRRGERWRCRVKGWPGPIPLRRDGCVMPPAPGRPAYGPEAREWARRLLRESNRERIGLSWACRHDLSRVARGVRGLGVAVYDNAERYMAQMRAERRRAARARDTFHVVLLPLPGAGVQLRRGDGRDA